MATYTYQTCGTCSFFEDHSTEDGAYSDCHANPPIMMFMDYGVIQARPEVEQDDKACRHYLLKCNA